MSEFTLVFYEMIPFVVSFIVLFWISPAILGYVLKIGLKVPHDKTIDPMLFDYYIYCCTVFQVIAVFILIVGTISVL